MMVELTSQQMFDAAGQLHRTGRSSDAELLCRHLLTLDPTHPQALHLLGVLTSRSGRHGEALELLDRAVSADPLAAEYRNDLGVVLQALGRPRDAIAAYRLALDLRPDLVDAWYNLANVLNDQRQWDEAITASRKALVLGGDERPQAHNALGLALTGQARFDEAVAGFRAALALEYSNPQFHNNLGAALLHMNQIEPAITAFRQAIALQPDHAQAHNNLGSALYAQGEIDQAIAEYRRAVSAADDLVLAHVNLAHALKIKGRCAEALAAFQRVLRFQPDDLPTHLAIADLHLAGGDWDAAATAARRILAAEPDNAALWRKLGEIVAATGEWDQAVAACQKAISLQPNNPEFHRALGRVYQEIGNIDEALSSYDRAIALGPTSAASHSDRIYALHLHPDSDAAAIYRETQNWNQLHALPLQKFIQPHDNDPAPDRRLRIGYVSSGFREEFVATNLLPLLKQHDRGRFEVFCYANVPRPDSFTELLRSHTDHWSDIFSHSDEHTATAIRGDAIDILVDLTQHAPDNRLSLFARKPAPIQTAYLPYCSTTGLDTIDYRLSDVHLDPPDADLSFYSEATIRLPETFWCYQPAGPTPEPSPPPLSDAGYVTFGCLSPFSRISSAALNLWQQILQAVPDSRLLIHFPAAQPPGSVLDRFAAHGISPDRLEFVGRKPWSQYIKTFSRIDISLDSLPFGGAAAICDSLWMGVPVVSLSGQTAVGRAGRSILSNIGMPELAARRPRQYVQIALALAQTPPRLMELRRDLRRRMLSSPLMNVRRFTRNIETAYRQMWRHWCRKQKP